MIDFCLGAKSTLEFAAKSLFITLKDKNNKGLITKQTLSHSRVIKKALEEDGYDLGYVPLREGKNYSSKPCSLFLKEKMDSNVADEISTGLRKMSHILDLKLVNAKHKKGIVYISAL